MNSAPREPIPQTNPVTEHITTSNLSSPLLQLPQELKNQIYTYLLGGKCIHIGESGYGYEGTESPYVLYSCRATRTASSAQRAFDTATEIDAVYKLGHESYDETEDTGIYSDVDEEMDSSNFIRINPHRKCYTPRVKRPNCMQTSRVRRARRPQFANSKTSVKTSVRAISYAYRYKEKETISLPASLLRTCRQIYNEANHTMYSANTFSFQCPSTIQPFVSHLDSLPSGPKTSAIRHLHLHMWVETKHDEDEWDRALGIAARGFIGLTSVDISIDQALWNGQKGGKKERCGKSPSMSTTHTFLAGMLGFGKLNFLRAMTLVVTDIYPREAWRPSKFRWPDAQKQEWVRDVRAEILGGK